MTITTEEAERLAGTLEGNAPAPGAVITGYTIAAALRSLAAERDALRAENARLREAMKNLLSHAERNECHHENTHRGGIIWTICDDCGGKWADDQGGLKPYCEPAEITNARAVLGETQ